ncbi:4898_t:CDS:1 [Funneliformis geosporum]|uniref:16172_t:CDS:1 n=1 Tax=Funneliformis geosporum TaxID=1117311 RepID=A0A9W4SQF2_9GLOM|nr:16172_t:CDS:1 [Funneliformis geosporum]CAI2193904.1 4898_t:CDS:1 [Funneliformis geosporum]
MFARQVFVHTAQNETTLNGLKIGRNFYKFNINSLLECFVKYNIRLNSSVSTIIHQTQKLSINKDEDESFNTSNANSKSSVIQATKPSLFKQMKSSTEKKLSVEELKEKTARIASMYKNQIELKEWTEEETKLLLMASKIHGNRWKFINRHYFNYRTLHSIKCKWYREKVKYENSHKTITSRWTPEEDDLLIKGIEKYGKGHWRKISRMLPNKEDLQVFRRYNFINYTKRGNFTEEEDNLLCDLLKKYGGNYWQKIADEMNRPVSTIIKHYNMVLLNAAKFPNWTDKENELIRDSILKYGKDWKMIQKLLPHRLSLSIKEHVRSGSLVDPYYNNGFWQVNETMRLVKAIGLYGKNWRKVSDFVETRSPKQCSGHFRDCFLRKGLEPYILISEQKNIS